MRSFDEDWFSDLTFLDHTRGFLAASTNDHSTGEGSPKVQALGISGTELSTIALLHLVDRFRAMIPYFPFVPLPSDLSITELAAERPFLLLAMVTCAASKYPRLQKALNEELKETLCCEAIVDGERSLDLLQGLLVYLAWYSSPDCFPFIHDVDAYPPQVSISLESSKQIIFPVSPDCH